jgi:type I restriction enzyme S subunit
LGQFFTPPKVKKLLVSLINPQVKENGKIESVFEPASGTGGILNTVIKHYKKFVKLGKITEEQLRQQLIKNIYGIEIKGKIFNLCLSNMLINTGEILPNVICADSIRTYHKIKVDNILANPPFSVTIDYDELLSSLGSVDILNDYIPIKAGGKNSEVLFLQMMIHCLNINGKCATVMLDGTKMYGSSSGYDTVREYLMKSCDLQEVILCPGGTFTSTASKTCILFFTKKKERKDVVEIKGKKRELEFIKSHSTKKVKFYDFNPDTEGKHFIKDVDIKDIASNNYSLNYTEYNIEEEEEIKEEGIEWIELGKVCEFKNGQNITKDKFIDGEYYVVGGGLKPFGVHNKYNVEENTIIISKDGAYAGFINKYNTKIFVSNHGIYISNYKNNVNKNYVYYFLKLSLQDKLYKLQNGPAQPGIKKEQIEKLKIPIIPIEKQNKIVKFLDELYENKQIKIQDTATYYESHDIFRLLLDEKFEEFEKLIEWQEQSVELNKMIDFYKNRQERYLYLIGKNNITTKLLEELFDIKAGKFNSKDCNPTGKYPFYTSKVNNPEGFIDEFCFDYEKYLILIKDGGAGEGKYGDSIGLGKVFKVSGKSSATSHQLALIPKINDNFEYLYLYLQSIKNKIMDMARYTIGLGCIRKSELEKIKIPLPSLEEQKEIVDYCEDNNKTIEMLKKEIEQNNILAQTLRIKMFA